MGAALLWGMLLAAPTGNKPASEGLARRQVQRDETHFDAVAIIPDKRELDA